VHGLSVPGRISHPPCSGSRDSSAASASRASDRLCAFGTVYQTWRQKSSVEHGCEAGRGSGFPSTQRYSMVRLCPSIAELAQSLEEMREARSGRRRGRDANPQPSNPVHPRGRRRGGRERGEEQAQGERHDTPKGAVPHGRLLH
jgi:hypothetical protein